MVPPLTKGTRDSPTYMRLYLACCPCVVCGNQAGRRMTATTAVVHSPWLLE